jgi:hypothetical protein
MPTNVKIRDLIVQHADLMIGDGVPQIFQDFCSHVASYEVLLAEPTGPTGLTGSALMAHPGTPFVEYVRECFTGLKAKQAALLKSK